ncbi:MAG: endonuclease MutS2 [Myxococcota bacterium]
MTFFADNSRRCLQDLGWPSVTEALASCCQSEPGRLAALDVLPWIEIAPLMDALACVRELMLLLEAGGHMPLGGLEDVGALVERCRRGGVLAPEPMRRVAATAQALGDTRRVLSHHAERLVAVCALAQDLADLRSLAAELGGTFDDAGEIRDSASPGLQAARRRRASLHQGLKARLERYIHDAEITHILQDDYYTVRDGRYVLPVVSSFQGELKGILHGSSQTGQTVFLEPERFIDSNNELTLAEAQVAVEERRVLEERSQWIAQEGTALITGVKLGRTLDLLQARARLGRKLDGVICELSEAGEMALIGAENPLLKLRGVPVIPNHITLADGCAFLIVTGPNTGGKTVTLNTVGLLSLMLQAGIPIPVAVESRALLFRGVHAVVGDPQDIQRDLSTFSGHLSVLQEVLDAASEGHLVLLDEIIVGTDPAQGAALAIAVLEALADRGARGLATTHYPRVKALALEDVRFANASVGVDTQTQAPTYRLSLGSPGDSSPLRIAEQLGFDGDILTRAHALASGGEDLSLAIRRLEESRAALEAERVTLQLAEGDLRAAEAALALERESLKERADAEVAALHQTVREEADAALQVIREQVRAAQRANAPTTLKASRRKVVEARARADAQGSGEASTPAGPPALPGLPAVGDSVWVRTLGAVGDVLEVRSKERVVVSAGGLKLTVRLEQLGAPPAKGGSAKRLQTPKPAAAPTVDAEDDLVGPLQTSTNTLDLRGFRRDEVEGALNTFFDRLYAGNVDACWVIHGHGTGAIRDEVRSLLKISPYVRDSRPGRRGEGDDGVSLVWLKSD